MKKMGIVLLIVLFIASCSGTSVDKYITDVPFCDNAFNETKGDFIPIASVSIPFSTYRGSIENFSNPCKLQDTNPLVFDQSSRGSHQMIVSFDFIAPIESIHWVQRSDAVIASVSIETSLNGLSYDRILQAYPLNQNQTIIPLGGIMAKHIRFVFDKQTNQSSGIQDLRFVLDGGFIVQEDQAWSNAFLRYSGWTGADGIFSYNLETGKRGIGDSGRTGFVFSDTFVGEVFTHNMLRATYTMIHNSMGYYDPHMPFEDAFSFDYKTIQQNAKSLFEADAYIGKRARHLLDADGLDVEDPSGKLTHLADGTMWLSNQVPNHLTIDLKNSSEVEGLYIWNYNQETQYGVKTFEILISEDNIDYQSLGTYHMDPASGSEKEPYTLYLPMNRIARYIRLSILESHNGSYVGLGKIMIMDQEGHKLFGSITAFHEILETTPHENSSRLWLQDGIVIDQTFYNFPLLIKDYQTIFNVYSVGLIQMPVRNGRFIYDEVIYDHTPLLTRSKDGGTLTFGAGILDQTDQDGYIYIYGYKDLNGRHLIVARVRKENFTQFNQWTYFDGQAWSFDIHQSAPLIDKVSPELSVTWIPTGIYQNQFMLVVMENSVSGTISYSVSNTPYGPFSAYTPIYQTSEHSFLQQAFTYNAKMHPVLSEPGNFLISYNVNTHSMGALRDARIYYPRFIRLIEVKEREKS